MILAKNKKAYFDYEILKEFTAGIILTGGEVRSCRLKQVNFTGSYVIFKENQIYLKSLKIAKFQYDQNPHYDPKRDKILLLSKKEIYKIQNEINNARTTVIPVTIFTKGRLIKVKIALAQGKRKYDKREALKKRDLERRKIS